MTLEVAIPDTSLTNVPGLREKTMKAGLIARALAIFRVDRIIVYKTGRLTSGQRRDAELLLRILQYMDTPQYLRRRIFPRSPLMRFVGLLPPLRTRSHPLEISVAELKPGDVRWGLQIRPGKVDIGLSELIDHRGEVDSHNPVLFRVVSVKPTVKLEPIGRLDTEQYFGYETTYVDDLAALLRESSAKARIGFSRYGQPFRAVESEIMSTVTSSRHVVALFGGPRHGLSDIMAPGCSDLKDEIDLWVNTIPNQGTETVRLEEALLISLGLLNNLVGSMITRTGFY
ncbi:MAG: putative RNA uridine N3 methyltransferase [Candidatus Thorarchaeota archaeon]